MADLAHALDIFAKLVAFDTTSRGSNLALIDYVEAFLRERGVEAFRVPSADGAKANLFAVIGPRVRGGVVLSGHTDVVPVDGQPWTSDPWTLTKRDGKYFGRGTADMKCFLALALAQVEDALAANLRRPIILAFSYDEEIGCFGVPHLIEAMALGAPKPMAVIVGEPTNMKVLSAHKGSSNFLVTVTGREAHSSQPHRGVSANAEAIKLMHLLMTMAEEAAADPPPQSLFEPAGATITIGRMQGGTANNILARESAFVWDLRWLPGMDEQPYIDRFAAAAAQADAAIKARAPEGGVAWRRNSLTPPLAFAPESPAETLARALTGDNDTQVASYTSEAGLFQRADLPVVLCGPGSIDQAHQPDEWIAEEQVAQGFAFIAKLIAQLRT
ncbi:MAG: acetylornithine deacetylase [Hyphomonadaceae bacterium]